MKPYLIFAFKNYGIFLCNEVKQDNGEIFLIGKFKDKRKEYTFIKHPNDIKIDAEHIYT